MCKIFFFQHIERNRDVFSTFNHIEEKEFTHESDEKISEVLSLVNNQE